MTAAAHSLHDHLHVNLIYGSGRDVYPVLVLGQYKGRGDVIDVQELVCRLCTHNGGRIKTLRRADGYSVFPVEKVGVLDGFRSGLVVFEIISEEFSDPCDVGSVPPEEGRGFKGSHTCL